MYFNLKHGDNTNLKGEVGEIIAKHHLNDIFSTKEYWYTIINKFNLNVEQKTFLTNNWKSFDLIDLKSLTIYEVKTRKYFSKMLQGVKNKIVITPSFKKVVSKAIELGFIVKVVEITLFSDWKYGINIKEFNFDYFWVHNPRPSGWERQRKNKL
jgi:hypothetical protein